MTAVSETVTVFDVVACLSTPVAHLAVVLAPCMNGSITNGDLGTTASLALEVGGLVHVAVDAMANTSYGISGGKTIQTLVHGQAFILKGLFQDPNAASDLLGFRVVSMEILYLALQHGVVFSFQGPIY